jgi:cullin 1
VALPPLLLRATEIFREYYNGQHNGRKLQWTNSQGTVIVKAMFGLKPFEITVTTLQGVVLSAFIADATSGTVTSSEIAFSFLTESLKLSPDILKRVLHSLSCGKFRVLKKSSAGSAVSSSDSFSVNSLFSCPTRKFRIAMATLEDNSNTEQRVDEERCLILDAAIVRIMKVSDYLSM